MVDLMADGRTVAQARRELGIGVTTWWRHTQDPRVADRIAHARAAQADAWADEIIEIADTESDAQRAKNRVDARKWLAAKMRPSVYGERLELGITQKVDLAGALADARARLRPVSDQRADSLPQPIEGEAQRLPQSIDKQSVPAESSPPGDDPLNVFD